jgi:hypothetical protein
MINEAPLARFAPLAGGLVKPIYADYSFGNIADTIEFLLTARVAATAAARLAAPIAAARSCWCR